MRRTEWTDPRLDDKMESIESNADLLRTEVRDFRAEFAGFRAETREEFAAVRAETREEFAALRRDFSALQTTLIQIGFGMVGVLLAAMIALIVAVA